jgi:hypothetical protein
MKLSLEQANSISSGLNALIAKRVTNQALSYRLLRNKRKLKSAIELKREKNDELVEQYGDYVDPEKPHLGKNITDPVKQAEANKLFAEFLKQEDEYDIHPFTFAMLEGSNIDSAIMDLLFDIIEEPVESSVSVTKKLAAEMVEELNGVETH